MKIACTVWSGGKSGDYIKGLPITISCPCDYGICYNGVLVEKNDAEPSQFALMFEFSGDKHKIRHVLYCCSASRPATEGQTKEDSIEVKTETLSLTASALPTGLVKAKTCESTDENTYNNWYKMPYNPSLSEKTTTTTTTKTS